MLIYRNDGNGDYTEEKGERSLAGQLVVEDCGDHFKVDQSNNWLFGWEIENDDCYARKMQKMGKISKGRKIGVTESTVKLIGIRDKHGRIIQETITNDGSNGYCWDLLQSNKDVIREVEEADPKDLFEFEEIAERLGYKIVPVVGVEKK